MDGQMQQFGKGIVHRLAVVLGSAALLLPLAEPLGQRGGVAARYLLAMAATAVATPAQAQTETITLVSNSGQGLDVTGGANEAEQAFTTGADPLGYTLTSITLHGEGFLGTQGNTVTLHSGSRTGTQVTSFTAMVSGATLVLTPPSTTILVKDTTYHLVTSNDLGDADWYATSSMDGGAVNSGAAEGWSIANESSYYKDVGNNWESTPGSFGITIKGYANTPPNTAPTVENSIQDQVATVGMEFSFMVPEDTFSDADTGDTLTYTATLSDGSDLPSWLNFDVDMRQFSGTPTTTETILVRVTATDSSIASIFDEFDIVVSLGPTACPTPTFGDRERIWIGNVTVANLPNTGYGFFETLGGDLDVKTFSVGRDTYTIDGIFVATGGVLDGDLIFSLTGDRGDSALPSSVESGLRLHLCDSPYELLEGAPEGANNPVGVNLGRANNYRWDLALDWSAETTRTLYLSLPANNLATGTLTITSDDAATVGDLLMADASAIMDDDGLPDSFTYQWFRENGDGTNQAPIPSATTATYELAAADVGKRVRVQVTFNDALGREEVLDSAAFPDTGTVMDASPPTVSLSGPSAAVTEGAGLTYTLTLDKAAPAGGLPVTVSVAETGDVVAAASGEGQRSVTIAAGQMQASFTVATVNDEDDEADSVVTVTIVADMATPATYTVGALNAATATVNDNDLPIVIFPIFTQTITEGQAIEGQFDRRGDLSGGLTVSVTVTETTGNFLSGTTPSSVTFEAGQATATFTVATEDDDVDESNSTILLQVFESANTSVRLQSTDGDSASQFTAEITVQDDDTRGVTVTGSPVAVTEGSTASYTLVLTSEPTADVTITPTSSDLDAVTVTPATLVFTDANWQTAQTVTVMGVADADTDNESVTITHTVAGGDYESETIADVMVTVTEVDTTAPTVLSIERRTPPDSPTNANSLTWRVTFSENVMSVDPEDFTLIGTSATLVVADVTAFTVFDVTASGGDLADFEGMVTLGLASGQSIVDTATTPNALSDTALTDLDRNGYLLDNTAPSILMVTRQSSGTELTNADSLTWRVTFSEAGVNVDPSDFDVTGTGEMISVMPVPGNTSAWDVTTTGGILDESHEATSVELSLNGNIEDEAGNALSNPEIAFPQFLYDNTAPTIISVTRHSPTAELTNSHTLLWEVTFSEAVTNIDATDFMLTGGTTAEITFVQAGANTYHVGAWQGDLLDYTGTVTLELDSNQDIEDEAGNALATPNLAGTSNSYEVDNTAPTVMIENVPPTSEGLFTVTISFSEEVSGFTETDITAGNGTLSGFTSTTNDMVWSVIVTPIMDGPVTLDIEANVATDRVGNDNTAAATATSTYTAPDNVAPTVTSIERQTPATSPTNAGSLTWRVTFSEAVERVNTTDFTVSGSTATITNVQLVVGETGVYDVTASGGDLAGYTGPVTLEFAGGQNIQDVAGNALATTNLTGTDNSYEVDNTAPTVMIKNVPPTSDEPFMATISFSEAVEGFTEAEITAENGTLSGFTPTITGMVWSVIVTPMVDGPVTLDIEANVATDGVGNGNTAAATATSIYTAPDTTAPTVTSIELEDPATSPTNENSLTWRVTFSEAVESVDTADFTVSGSTATVTNAQPVSGETGVYDVTASSGDLAGYTGTVTLELAGGQNIQDAAGNALATTTLAGTNNSYDVDNTAPTVTINVPTTSIAAFQARITFSEAVSGFTETDITAVNGTLSDFNPTTPGTVWTVLVTPAADGQVTLEIGVDVATDAAGNGNTAAAPASSTYTAPNEDTVAPVVTSITRQDPDTSPTNGDSLTWRVAFSEAVVDVDDADFEVSGTNATLNVVQVPGQTVNWDVTVSGGDLADKNGTVTLSFAADQDIADEADNALASPDLAGTNNSYEVDNTAPMVEITDVPAASDGPFTATISFSEAVAGFGQSDITAGNGTLSDFNPTTPDTVWSVSVTPMVDGPVTLQIEASVATDAAGNDNTAATQASSTYTAPDTDGPTVISITRQDPATSPTNGDSLTWRVVFSETVENVDSTDFLVSGTTAIPSVAEVTTQTGAWDVTISGGDLADKNGTVTLSFAANPDITDEADNALASTTPTLTDDNSYELDNTAPMVSITNVPAASDGPFMATISFSEAVTGFGQSDITAENGNLSGFTPTTPSTIWTVLVTPAAGGDVTLEIGANVAVDAVGNDNTAATQASSTYTAPDTDGPTVISITRQDPATSPTNGDSLTWRVVFSETVENVDSTDFLVSGTTAIPSVEEVTTQTGAWDVTISGGDLADKNGTVTLSFAANQDIADEADNALASTTPTITDDNSYELDNTAPTVRYPVPTSLMVGTAIIPITPATEDTEDTDIASASATGLPAGLVIDELTGVISGTPTAASTAPSQVVVTVSDQAGNSATQTLAFPVVAAAAQPGVSILPASLSLDEGVTASYTVTLNTRPTGAVTLTPTSGDSGAVGVSPNRLTFTATDWDRPRTVSVMGVDDPDTTDETVTISHSVSGYGTVSVGAVVTVSVTDTTPDEAEETKAQQEAKAVLEDVVLPEVLQQVTARTTEAITSRLNTIASGSLPTAPITLSLDDVVADTVAFFHGEREQLKDGSLEWQQALAGRSFAFPLFSSLNLAQGQGASPQEGPFSSLALWGGADYSSYGNTMETTDVDGKGFSGTIGMDMQPIPRLVTGLALTTSRWELDYTTAVAGDRAEGTYEVGITTVNPYVNWLATEQLSLWVTFGYGRGQVEQTPDGEGPATSSDSLTSWAGGLRFEVVPGANPLTGEGSPFGLAFKVDGATSSFLDADVQLARLAAEVSRSFTTVENGLLTAAVELGWSIRSVSDKDDADGDGAELAGRLNWLSMDGSGSATVDARVVLGGGDRKEWGMGGHFRFTAPYRPDGEGLSLSLQPSFGVTGTRLEELWSLSGDGTLAMGNDQPGGRLDAQLAYGFPLGNALLTPYMELTWAEAANAYGTGLRYGLPLSSMELDLKGVRRSNAEGNPEHRLLLQLRSDL